MIPDHFTHMNALRVFCVVAEERDIRAAARRLNMTGLSVSRQISVLERVLEEGHKTPLFTNTPDPLTLTERGELLYLAIHKMFQDPGGGMTPDHPVRPSETGRLRVCTSTVFGAFWLMPLVPEFLARYPHIQLSVIIRDDESGLNLNEADVLISWTVMQQPWVVATHMGEGRLRAYASRDYLKTFGTPRTPEDLDHHRIVAWGHGMPEVYNALNRPLWLLTQGRPPDEPREPVFTVNNVHCLMQAIQYGLGIGPSHHFAVASGFARDLVEILPDYGTPVPRYLCYPEYLKADPAFQTFRDFLIEKITLHPL